MKTLKAGDHRFSALVRGVVNSGPFQFRRGEAARGRREPAGSSLSGGRPTIMLDGMKTLTTREFFHSPGLVKSLRPGHSLTVTDKGVPAFTLTKAGQPRVKTVADLEREAREMFPEDRPQVNFTAVLKKAKQ